MKKAFCRDMGNDCFFGVKGETDKEVLYKIRLHLWEVHTKQMNEMFKTMSQAEIKALLLSKVKDTSASGPLIKWQPPF